jgi:hypothetical protein
MVRPRLGLLIIILWSTRDIRGRSRFLQEPLFRLFFESRLNLGYLVGNKGLPRISPRQLQEERYICHRRRVFVSSDVPDQIIHCQSR